MQNDTEELEGAMGSLLASYDHLMVNLRDPRSDSWPLMSSIWPTTFICIAYVYIVKVAGPNFMKNREPYNIKGIMIAYNLFQTLFSAWMCYVSWTYFGFYPGSRKYSWHCEPVDYSNSPDSLRILSLAWWYFFSKFVDLFDTFFFVARKKYSHVSALHVIHHSTLPWLSWWGPKFVGGGQAAFGPFLNSGIHTLMYFYYLCAALGPWMQPYLWWKKYLTTLQLVQFVMVFFHAMQPIFFQCDFPLAASLMFCGTGLQYFILFSAFYKKTYRKPKSTSANGEKTPTISENGTKKAPAVCKEEEKKLSDTEDLLEDLGRATDKVRRDSLKVVELVRRNSLTPLARLKSNSFVAQKGSLKQRIEKED